MEDDEPDIHVALLGLNKLHSGEWLAHTYSGVEVGALDPNQVLVINRAAAERFNLLVAGHTVRRAEVKALKERISQLETENEQLSRVIDANEAENEALRRDNASWSASYDEAIKGSCDSMVRLARAESFLKFAAALVREDMQALVDRGGRLLDDSLDQDEGADGPPS
jgi:FtsZ-binding cell division protein ZapB